MQNWKKNVIQGLGHPFSRGENLPLKKKKNPNIRDFSAGTPEGSKHNLNFWSATWHHLAHFQRKPEGFQPVIGVGGTSWPG